MLTAADYGARAIERLAILDKPQPIDPLQRFDKKRISAAFDASQLRKSLRSRSFPALMLRDVSQRLLLGIKAEFGVCFPRRGSNSRIYIPLGGEAEIEWTKDDRVRFSPGA